MPSAKSPLIKPFRGLRPTSETAAAVAAPPYDVMSSSEARQMVVGRPWSFLHISRPEVDLPEGSDPYGEAVYAKAAENLQHACQSGVLFQDEQECYYVYRLTMGEHRQTGLVAIASVSAYDQGRIKRHEFTRPTKEDDRVRQIDALNAQTGPVFLVYSATAAVDQQLAETTALPPEICVTAEDGVIHELWSLSTPATLQGLSAAFAAMPALYIADGHHRSAAASRVAAARRSDASGEQAADYFLSVIFPHDQMQILPYNRVVRDLNGLNQEELLRALGETFQLEPSSAPVAPHQSGCFGLYLPGQWYRLTLPAAKIPKDPVKALDVSLLADQLIEPLLGISDPRRDERIDFVGGIRGLGELERRVDSGEMAVAFSLYPTSMEQLMAVADADQVMPPKSTWFEPKLADGLVSHLIGS